MNTQDIKALLVETLADQRLSRNEKKSVAAATESLTPAQLAVWRSQAFDVAREQSSSGDAGLVFHWLERVNKALLPGVQAPVAPSKAYFSPGRAPCDRIISGLRGARRTVDICVFTITDNEVSKEIDAAHRRGIAVRILTDNDKSEDRGSDVKRLADGGVAVRMDVTQHHMHHKFALFDSATLLSGSYNWTRSAKNFNQENLIATSEAKLVSAFGSEFERLWTEARPYD